MSKYGQVRYINDRVRGNTVPGHCHTLRGRVIHPRGPLVSAHIKVFDRETEAKGIFNEVLAAHVASLLKIHVVNAFVCAGPVVILKKWVPDLPNAEFVRCAASQTVTQLPIQELADGTSLFDRDLLQWRDIAKAAVFDEWLANADRTPHNVLRVGFRNFVLLDHEKSFGGPKWTPESLARELKAVNAGNEFLGRLVGARSELQIAQARRFAREIADTISVQLVEITRIGELSLLASAEIAAAADFLAKRAKILPSLVDQQIQKCQHALGSTIS